MAEKIKLPELFSQRSEIMSGAIVFKGTRVPLQTFFDHLDHGGTIEQFLDWYEGVSRAQLEAAEEIRTAPKPAKRRGAVGLLKQFRACPTPLLAPPRHELPFK